MICFVKVSINKLSRCFLRCVVHKYGERVFLKFTNICKVQLLVKDLLILNSFKLCEDSSFFGFFLLITQTSRTGIFIARFLQLSRLQWKLWSA